MNWSCGGHEPHNVTNNTIQYCWMNGDELVPITWPTDYRKVKWVKLRCVQTFYYVVIDQDEVIQLKSLKPYPP